ncbi:hypothetical protein ACFQY7_30040 [Actinomadura luteofluorescens]|uniref:hypothetical protein n=1 Tax=Actinomadura luteofluorescens TaxID=46163 RepID=UPI00363CAE20
MITFSGGPGVADGLPGGVRDGPPGASAGRPAARSPGHDQDDHDRRGGERHGRREQRDQPARAASRGRGSGPE